MSRTFLIKKFDGFKIYQHVPSMAGFRDSFTIRDTDGVDCGIYPLAGEIHMVEADLIRLRDALNEIYPPPYRPNYM